MDFMQISNITYRDSQYPDRLRQISSAPKQLYILGDLTTAPYIAIVGTRRPTEYGRIVTHQLATNLARAGIVIVSGLALGIDAMAHQAAIEAGGKTVAVQACGLDRFYPSSNRRLGERILETGGAVVSEYPEGTPPLKHHFPARNRIIAGLSHAVIVPEADASSGSLITAGFALNQNRLVMAVPGNTTSLRSAGPNNLIKSGAIPVTDATDVLAALNLESPLLATTPIKADSKEEATILGLISEGHTTTQALIEESGLPASQFANVITLMEISGKVRNLGAGQWITR